MSDTLNNQQIRDILTAIARVSRGNYDTGLETSGRHTEFDSIAAGLNMMINELRARQENLEEQKKEIDALNESLTSEISERKQADTLYRTITENSSNGIYIVQNKKFVFFNEVFRTGTGYTHEELLAMNSIDIIHPDDRERVRQNAIEMLKGHRTGPYEFRIISKSGETLWSMETVTSIVYNGQRASMGNFVDITERKKNEEALVFSDTILKSIHEGIIAMDTDFRVTYWNDVSEELYGIKASDAVGKNIGDLMQMVEEFEGQNIERISNLIEKGMDSQEQLYSTPRGKVWVDVHIRAIEQNGSRTGWVTIASDISERKRMQSIIKENEEKYSTVFYANPVPMTIYSPETLEVIDVNTAFELYNGYSRQDCIGRTINELSFFVYPEQQAEIRRVMAEKGRIDNFEAQMRTGTGETRTMLLSCGMITLGGKNYFITAANDVTQQKIIERQIQNTNRQLDEQNYRLKAQAQLLTEQREELIDKNREVERANQMKSEFLASMSHELRTPLNAIIGFSELMLDGITGEVNDEQKECLNDIHNSGQHLLELINDVLDLSKVEVGKMEFKPVNIDIKDVINDSVQTVRSLLDQKGHTVSVNVEDGIRHIFADKSRLRQVILNLLSNAIKFTRQGGRIEIFTESNGDLCRVGVKDNGIGIKKEDQERVFEVFTQAETIQDETPKGTGLGLTLTRQFLAAMGGTIWVESEYGKGSTFYFTIPFARTEQAAAGKEAAEKPRKKGVILPVKREKKLVLVVDDDGAGRRLLAAWLTEENLSIEEASSADEGISKAEELQPDVIVLDILMPEKDGWYALRELKSNSQTCRIPVVIASVSEEREVAYSLGAVDYFNKPINKKRFQSRIVELGITQQDRVLVVDDNPADVRLVASILEAEGIEAIPASGGKEGIELILKEKPSLIVLDIMMPDLTGFEVIEKLRETEGVLDIPIIVMTSKDLTNEEVEYLSRRTEGVIKKAAFSREDFVQTVKKLLESGI